MSRKKQVYEKITALYCRISLDDGGDNESMSISNQKIMLRDFAEKHGMFQYEYYVDDGYTGRNFNRPAFQRMIADIEAGKIGCVITKDLSRLGRNYIEAGSYIEIFFPKHNVRYIAITDGVDSLTRQEMDITPFKNILNDMYSRDISKKVLAGITTRSRQGKFCGGTPPFGLMRDPEDKGHLIIDPETAPIIRKIYDYALDGLGCMRISKRLMEEKIPITHVKANTEFDANYYSWGGARISHILRNPFYKGAHLVCRTHQKGIRSNTYDIIPREDWEVIEGCHEAIVTPEEKADFEKAPNGAIGMETSLSAGITALVKQGHCTMLQLIEKMSTKPAQLLGIPAGTLKKGSPADVILIDKDEEWTVDVDKLHGKSKNCVFKNRKLTGKVKFTVCGGKIVFNELD